MSTLAQPGDGYPGDIDQAAVEMSLVPVGAGGPVAGTCTPVVGGDSTCTFSAVPANTYMADATVGGYYNGSGEDVLVVFDPSLGFTTGGGWFYWPGTDERTNFGYTMKYNRKRTKVQGSLLVIRHTDEGVYRLKSNAVGTLAIGSDTFSFASFSGKATYQEPGEDAEGAYEFLSYVEDHATPGAGADRFWIAAERAGVAAIGISLGEPILDNAATLEGGNIVVPQPGGGGGRR